VANIKGMLTLIASEHEWRRSDWQITVVIRARVLLCNILNSFVNIIGVQRVHRLFA